MVSDETERLDGASAEPGEEHKAVPLMALDSKSLLSWFAGILASRVWVDIGLLADPLTGQLSKDLDGARLAIDVFDGLVKALKGKVSADETRHLEGMLADLRLNFVRQAGSP